PISSSKSVQPSPELGEEPFLFARCHLRCASHHQFFVHRDLQTDNFLPYGAIDCIAVNRCV
ncbi:hypothetical protein, partial [Stenotrophomonas maltophilia]|uniref:hypothetical protein n=1 Tax=Stenotrophomonas maltophilia TaxID=40324 RepID=UPI0039C2FCFC